MSTRRSVFAVLAATAASITAGSRVAAQFSEQEVRNGAQITSTGDVVLTQAASGNQEVGVVIDGQVVSDDGIYRDGTRQVIINDGQVTATGDVEVIQSASGQQTVQVQRLPRNWEDGMPADVCEPGKVIASPHGVLFYQRDDCCYYLVPCIPCQPKCKGDVCTQGK